MAARRRSRKTYLPATKLAALGYCEQKLLLQRQWGDLTTRRQKTAREEGIKQHEAFHADVVAHHNRPRNAPSVRDSRCFIATAVYGGRDPRTEALRRYRDERLMQSSLGRMLVKVYYRTSPSVVGLAGRAPWLVIPLRVVLDRVVEFVGRTQREA